VDRTRVTMGPRSAVLRARSLGSQVCPRSSSERAALGRLIRLVDRFWPGGPNCYRRVLMELATDPKAANDIVTLGFAKDGGPRSGHAWMGAGAPPDQPGSRYDAIISI
jgi:hypothetical protein